MSKIWKIEKGFSECVLLIFYFTIWDKRHNKTKTNTNLYSWGVAFIIPGGRDEEGGLKGYIDIQQ